MLAKRPSRLRRENSIPKEATRQLVIPTQLAEFVRPRLLVLGGQKSAPVMVQPLPQSEHRLHIAGYVLAPQGGSRLPYADNQKWSTSGRRYRDDSISPRHTKNRFSPSMCPVAVVEPDAESALRTAGSAPKEASPAETAAQESGG
jgi:hypothetical protein